MPDMPRVGIFLHHPIGSREEDLPRHRSDAQRQRHLRSRERFDGCCRLRLAAEVSWGFGVERGDKMARMEGDAGLLAGIGE